MVIYKTWLLNNTIGNHIRCVNKQEVAESSLLFQSCRKDLSLIFQRISLAAKEFPYDFLPFAAETRDTFYWDPNSLTSVFLALHRLRVVAFVWGIEWVMRRKEAQSATLPLGCDFSKVASLQIGPMVVMVWKDDKIYRNYDNALSELTSLNI